MTQIILYDTETTGLPLYGEPSEDPRQPHLCQFTAMLFDNETWEEIEYVNHIIWPDGWEIPPELTALHGISQQRALAEGVAEAIAVNDFLRLTGRAEVICAYGLSFDMRIMRIAMLRHGISKDACDHLAKSLRHYCLQAPCTPLAKVPPTDKMMAAGRKTFKTPKLAEAVKAILGEDMNDAHDARADVLYSFRLFQHINPKF